MQPRWKVLVEGLGKIERAEVEARPLMLLVGENNSGKSYLASLLWGILARQEDIPLDASSAVVRQCREWVESRWRQRNEHPEHVLGEQERELFNQLLNEAFASNMNEFARGLFNDPATTISNIHVSPRPITGQLKFRWQGHDPDNVLRYDNDSMEVSGDFLNEDHDIAVDALARFVAYWVSFGEVSFSAGYESSYRPFRGPIFLPASRTGFMLLYKAAVRRQIRQLARAGRREEASLDLTLPAIEFLELLAVGMKPDQGDHAEEAAFLEQGMGGKVELVAGAVGVNDYRYSPAGSAAPLTMALSSSLVTELAPLVLVLRHMSNFPVLILEEPEAHLHPHIQRRLAQVIVRLIRKGLYVWITTHSENFCQQINNFIKLGSLPPEKRAAAQNKLGYEAQDYLDLDDVGGYQFTPNGERSVVTELKKTPRGLVMPTFNYELTELSKETRLLQRLTTEEG